MRKRRKEGIVVIAYTGGSILNTGADCIFNTVNCEGRIDKGMPYQFKLKYPENCKAYEEFCRAGKMRPGILFVYNEKGKTIVNFPVKDKWRDPSSMNCISEGLDEFFRIIPELGIRNAAIPPLECEDDGVGRSEIRQLVEEKLNGCNIDIELYEPVDVDDPDAESVSMTLNDLLLLHIRRKLESATTFRLQMTMYFTNYYYGRMLFHFSRGKKGPFSKDLDEIENRIIRFQGEQGVEREGETYGTIFKSIDPEVIENKYGLMYLATNRAISFVNITKDDQMLKGTAMALYLIRDERIEKMADIIKEFKAWAKDMPDEFNDVMIRNYLFTLERFGMVVKNPFDKFWVL